MDDLTILVCLLCCIALGTALPLIFKDESPSQPMEYILLLPAQQQAMMACEGTPRFVIDRTKKVPVVERVVCE